MNYPTYYTPYNYGPYAPQQGRPEGVPTNPPQMQNAQQGAGVGQSGGFSVRPVTGREEAVAVPVDFLGPGTLMPDLPHGTIYLKRFNPQTGSSEFYAFVLPPPEPEPDPVQYATRQDLDALREEIVQLIPKKGGKRYAPDE